MRQQLATLLMPQLMPQPAHQAGWPLGWFWLLPLTLLGVGGSMGLPSLVGLGIGLAAALSLSGSI